MSDLFKTKSGMGKLNAGLQVFDKLLTNTSNLLLQNSQNRFNARQADLQRQWQEDMYNKYSSPSAMVQQYKQAGLNPALANNGQGQIFSGSTAQASQTIPFQSMGFDQLGPALMGVASFFKDQDVKDSQIEDNLASAELKQKEAIGKTIDNIYKGPQYRAVINEINQNVATKKSEEELKKQEATLTAFKQFLTLAQSTKEISSALINGEEVKYKRWINEEIKKNGGDPTSPWSTQVANLVTSFFNSIGDSSPFFHKEIIHGASQLIDTIQEAFKTSAIELGDLRR